MDIVSLNIERNFLETHFTEIQFAAIFGGMVLMFLIEGVIPRRVAQTDQTSRWLSNIGLALFNHFFIIFYSLIVIQLVSTFQPESPLLQHFKISDLPAFFIVLITMEFISYWIHRAFHRIPLLWRIHMVHHTDTEVDVTTSHRHHPFEPMINTLILTPILFALGAPVIVLVLYSLLNKAISLISHSNIVLPEKLDKVLRLFVITPDFHRMHHSSEKKYTDSNYSLIVPWFDYLFNTATSKPYREIPTMELGLKTLRSTKDNRLDKLFLTPFIFKKTNS